MMILNERKDKISSFTHAETFNIYIIYIQVVLNDYTNMSQQLEIYIYYSMNKKYVEVAQKWKKAYLMMLESKMCLYFSMARAGDSICSVQRTKAKEGKNGFLGLSCDPLQTCLYSKGDDYSSLYNGFL